MEIKFNYIIKKIKNKLDAKRLKNKSVFDNFYLQNYPLDQSDKFRKILLYFPDYQFMHLGDHLFFEPVANMLKNYGFNLYVQPIKPMEFYFKQLGYQIGNIKKDKFDLIISRIEFLPVLKNNNSPVVYIEIANISISQPLIFDIIDKTAKLLKIKIDNIMDIPRILPLKEKLSNELMNIRDTKDKYILFNNYIDSGSFRVFGKHFEKIENFTKELKREFRYKVIHIGSLQDKKKDNKTYDFVDIDLRGKTSIEDLFYLVQLQNVIYNVSFDAFQMHLFFMTQKKSYILFRGRFTKKATDLFINYFNPPFRVKEEQSCLIEYI